MLRFVILDRRRRSFTIWIGFPVAFFRTLELWECFGEGAPEGDGEGDQGCL